MTGTGVRRPLSVDFTVNENVTIGRQRRGRRCRPTDDLVSTDRRPTVDRRTSWPLSAIETFGLTVNRAT
jgi:hypothetical protein